MPTLKLFLCVMGYDKHWNQFEKTADGIGKQINLVVMIE